MSSKSPSIVFLTQAYPDDPTSYRGIFVKDLATCLSGMGMEIIVITPRIYPQSKPHEREGEINVFRFSFPSGGKPLIAHSGIPIFRMAFYLFAGFFRTWTAVRRFNCDLIHVHWIHPNGLISLFIKAMSGRPFIVHVRGTDLNVFALKNAFFRALTRSILGHSSAIICTSEALKHRLLTAFPGVAEKQIGIEVIYNAVDTSLFHPIPEREARNMLRIPLKGLHFLFVGNLVGEKGVQDLAIVMTKILKQKENRLIYLHIIGKGPLEDTIRNLIGSFEDHVFLHRAVSHREIPLWLNASNLLILPSHAEGMPNVVLESLACGTPVLATRVGDIPKFVMEGKSGFLMDAERLKEELKVKLEDIIEPQHQLKDMKERLQRNLRTQKAKDTAPCGALARLYKDVIHAVAKK